MRLFAARCLDPKDRADAYSGRGRACGATGSALASTRCPFLPRGQSDQLPSRAQLFFALIFDWHLAGKHESVEGGTHDVFEVEPGMPTGSSKVQRRHCCAARKTQPMPSGCVCTRGGCWGDGGCRNIEEFVRSGECMPKIEGPQQTEFFRNHPCSNHDNVKTITANHCTRGSWKP